MKLFLLCFFEVLLGITVYAQPRYRMMVDPPVQVVSPPPNAAFVNLCFREQGSVNTSASHCPLGVGSYVPNGPDQPIDMLDNIGTNNTSIPPAYPTEEIEGNITILGVGLLVNIQDSGTNSLASHIFTQIGGEAPGTLFTIPSTQINGTNIVFTITIGATCLEEDTGVDCNTPPVTETTEITTATSTTMPMTTEAPITEELTSASTTGELATETQTGVSSSTSPTTTEEGAGNADAQSIVPIAAGVGGGVAALLLLLLVVVVIVMRKKRSGKRNKEYRVRQTDANDLNHYDAGAGNAGTSGAGNIESSGALPLYAVVDTSDDVPLEESLYEFTDGNGVPSRDGGGVGGGIDEESKPAHTKTDYEDTYNIPDSNAYNTIAQHGSQDGEVTYNQLSHGQNQEEATYNQLSHGQNQEEATYNQLSHGQDQEEATYNQLSHGQNQEEATYNQLSHGQDQEEATYNQLSHNQPSRGGEIPYNKLSHGQNQEVTYNQLSVGHQRKQLEVHGSQEGLSTYASLGQPETREPSTGQENESVYYNTAAGTQNPDKKHDPMNVGTEAHNGTNNEVYYNTGDLKQASPGKHVYTDVNVTSSPMKSTSTPGSNSQKPVVYSDINSVLTAFSSK